MAEIVSRLVEVQAAFSGGMRQRVGFARALVVDPTLLLMDEPFSALDVLTAETLRTDLLDLWTEGRMPIKSVLIVTHNIEEAVFMCDRILLLSSNPGRVIAEIKVPFSHPRNRLDPQFRRLVDDVYAKMTARPTDGNVKKGLKLGTRLPHVSTNLIAGLIETLAAAPYFGRADMPEIALSLHLEVDELFPIAEVLQSLGFADGDVQARKVLFAEHLLRYVPLAALIKNVLDERPGHRAPRVRFEQELEDSLSDSAAKETLDTVINWGRYGEIFSYNDQTAFFSLEDVEF
ncbi:TPA: AAA-associated domain-containing protein [Serratia marcescens]|jgi:NitT/TauT family transport system ATP-binding protein